MRSHTAILHIAVRFTFKYKLKAKTEMCVSLPALRSEAADCTLPCGSPGASREQTGQQWGTQIECFLRPLTPSLVPAAIKPFFAFQRPITVTAKVMSECGFSPASPQLQHFFKTQAQLSKHETQYHCQEGCVVEFNWRFRWRWIVWIPNIYSNILDLN